MISTAYSGLPSPIVVAADLNGDGITGDLLPGSHRGSLNREIDTPAKLNKLIRDYNLSIGGKTLPRGGQAPFAIDGPDGLRFGDSFISQDLQVSKIIKLKERLHVELTAQVFNIFNVSNLVGSGGFPGSEFNGTLTTVAAANGAPGGFRLGTDGSLLNA